ncbi:hypothetical protein LguiA_029733 [Lonicera macranthoides]
MFEKWYHHLPSIGLGVLISSYTMNKSHLPQIDHSTLQKNHTQIGVVCSHCRNGSGQIDVGDIFVHLMKNGIDEEYIFWCFHGETSGVPLVDQPQLEAISNTPRELEESNFPKLNDLVNDVCEMFMGETNPPTPLEFARDAEPHKSKKYDRLHRLAKFESTIRCQQGSTSKHRIDDFTPWLRDEARTVGTELWAYEGIDGGVTRLEMTRAN